MTFERRDYQKAAHEHMVAELLAGRNVLVVSPTGSGKSLILIDVLQDPRLRKNGVGPVLTVPNEAIALGVYDKMDGADPAWIRQKSEVRRAEVLQGFGIWTTTVLHNRLLSGDMAPPPYLLHDEGHHSVDNTHVVIHAACGYCPRAAVTATDYRGTPDETAKLRKAWGEPWVALKLRKAVETGVIARPNFEVWPLVNDDLITIRDGEFVLSGVEGATEDALPDLVQRCKALWDEHGAWRRPTMFRVSSVRMAEVVAQALNDAGMPAAAVVGGTEGKSRQNLFGLCLQRAQALVQVRVVGEGVDLPIRTMVDLAPTVSPLLWMQAVGRITRPTDDPPLYIATNHNITRHAYLWEGLIPPAMVRDAQKVWGPDWKPQRRHLARALGLEGFGRFTVTAVPLVDGSSASLYALQTKDGLHLYAVLLHPSLPEPFFFEKRNTATGRRLEKELPDGRTIEYAEKKYGPWRRIESIPSAEGYVSVKAGPVTEPMLDYWERAAEGRGLDPNHLPDWRQFQALPMLVDTRTSLRME